MNRNEQRGPCPLAATSLQGIVEGTMDRFRFSDGAVRELEQIVGNAAPRIISQLETMIRSYENWYGYSGFAKAKRANATCAARVPTARDDFKILKKNLEDLARTIDTIARRERTRRGLEHSSLSESMRYRGISAWDDASAVRELASRLLNRVTNRLRPTVRAAAKKAGAPRVDRLPLGVEVATILRAAGIPLAKTRDGLLDQVLKVAFKETEGSAPKDLMRLLIKVCDEMAHVSAGACQHYVRERFPHRVATDS